MLGGELKAFGGGWGLRAVEVGAALSPNFLTLAVGYTMIPFLKEGTVGDDVV